MRRHIPTTDGPYVERPDDACAMRLPSGTEFRLCIRLPHPAGTDHDAGDGWVWEARP